MRFLVLLASVLLLVVSGVLAALLAPASLTQLSSLAREVYVEALFARLPLALTAERLVALKILVGGVLLASALSTAALLNRAAHRAELRALGQEIGATWFALVREVNRRSKGEKTIASGLLGAILAVRTGVLVTYGFRYDELSSYMFFVREGPVAVSTYYPLPNNHVFFNLCCTALQPLLSQWPLLVMRLPSFVAAGLGTALSYAALTRVANFRLATLVTGLFNLAPAGIYYAISGRGYYVQFVFIQLGFFAVIALGSLPDKRRLAWLVFVTSSVLGLYTIPTYAYPLASLAIGALLVAKQRDGARLPQLLFALGLIGASTLLLYAPIGAVSGWPQLLGNSYITPMSWSTFLATAKANVYEKAYQLFGAVRPVLLAGIFLTLAVPVVLWRNNTIPARLRSLSWTTWALLITPMGLVVLQRTYPPVRAVAYLAYFGFVLAALGAWYGAYRGQLRSWKSRWGWVLILGCIVAATATRFRGVLGRIRSSQHEEAQLTQAWQWLQARQPRRVLLNSYQLFFYYYASRTQRPVVLADQPASGRQYDYLVLPAQAQAPPAAWALVQRYQAVYRNDLVSIFGVVPATPPTRRQ